jgi:sRNA-binding regulator protein Hfq
MSNKESMVGKTVSLFLIGGWQVRGEVKSFDENRFVVEQDGDLFLVFKDKVACLHLVDESEADLPEAPVTDKVVAGPTMSDPMSTPTSSFPMNSMSYEESGMSIPRDLLSGGPAPPGDDDLGVFFSKSATDDSDEDGLDDGTKVAGGISFGVEKNDSSD